MRDRAGSCVLFRVHVLFVFFLFRFFFIFLVSHVVLVSWCRVLVSSLASTLLLKMEGGNKSSGTASSSLNAWWWWCLSLSSPSLFLVVLSYTSMFFHAS